jgi:uncharacterized Tic20 family protein
MAETFQPERFETEAATPPLNDRGRCYDLGIGDDEKTWAMLAHLSLLGHLVLPVFSILAPIIIWAVKKDDSSYVGDHAREAINFQITLILYHLIAIPLAIVTCGIGGLLVLVAYVLGVIGMVMAAIAANRCEFFRYPMTFRLVR